MDTGGLASPASATVSATPSASAATSLQLNGTSQYVTFGAAPGLNAQDFTLELWFRRTGTGVGTSTGTGGIANAIPLITKGRAEAETPANLNMNYFLGIDATTGQLVADFEEHASTAANHPVTGTTVVTRTSGTTRPPSTTPPPTPGSSTSTASSTARSRVGGSFTPESTSIQHAAVGSAP